MARRKKSDAELLGSVEAYKLLDNENFDPEHLLVGLQAAIKNNFDFRVASEFDEREIPRYPNFFEFVRRGLNVEPYPRQLQLIMHHYGEICMFCSDPNWAYNMYDQPWPILLEHIVFMRFGRCPRCKKTRRDMLINKKWWFPNRIAMLIGQRAGKTMTLGMTSLYQDHLFLTLELEKNGQMERVAPYEYYGMMPTFVRQAFTAVTAGQAFDNIWDNIVSIRQNSPWYNTFFEFLKFHGQRLGQELFKVSDTFISYNYKRMGSTIKSPHTGKLRGATRYMVGIDEICLFNSGMSEAQEKKVGDVGEVWTSLNNSLRTIRNEADRLMREGRYDVPNAFSMDLSSPFDVNDILSRHLREARTNPRITAAHYATWEFSPKYTQEGMAEEFIKDPEKAWRDFGAIPPLANSPWMSDKKSVISCVRQQPDPNYVQYRQLSGVNEQFGDTTIWLEVDKVNMNGPHVVGIDLGLVNNAFALTIGSLEAGNKVRIDACFMLKPPGERVKINLDKLFTQFIEPLVKRVNPVVVAYDHWNSEQSVRSLRDQKIDARQHTLTPADFSVLRNDLSSSQISLPFAEFNLGVLLERDASVDVIQTASDKPNFSLVLQTLTVREIGNGKVVKPRNGDDDVFRSMALVHRFVRDEDVARKLLSGGLASSNRGAGSAIGAISHMSRGAGSGQGSSGRVGSFMATSLRSKGRH